MKLMKKFFCLALICIFQTSMYSQTPATKTTKKPTNAGTPQLPKPIEGDNVSADSYMKDGEFDIALAMFLEEYKKKKEDVELNVKIGKCYLETNFDKKAAIDYLEFAQNHVYKNNEINLLIGQAYLHAERFDDALAKFETYKSSETKHPENIATVEKFITYATNAKALKAKPLNITFQNLGDAVNSNKTDNMPIIDPLETALIFNSNRTYLQDYAEYIWDILTSENKGNKWKKAHSISTKINTLENEFLAGTSPFIDFLIVRPDSYESTGDLTVSPLVNKKFDTPQKLSNTINGEKDFESSACLSSTGDTIYFSSNKPGGMGGFDIYYSIRIGSEWGLPQNAGSTINTSANEEYPNISIDGKSLYFASDGAKSMGGYDILMSTFDENTQQWGTPQNIGYPLNTTYDDMFISFTASQRYAYVSQVRSGGLGEYDIYRVINNDIEAPLTTFSGIVAKGDTTSSVPLNQIAKNISIKVIDKKNNSTFGEYSLTKSSRYVISLPPGSFSLLIEAEDGTKFEKTIDIADKQPENPLITSDIYIRQ